MVMEGGRFISWLGMRGLETILCLDRPSAALSIVPVLIMCELLDRDKEVGVQLIR